VTAAAGLVAVTGATGFVGHALLDEAQSRGFAVRALTRRKQDARAGVEWVRGNLANRASLDALVRGAEAVIHVAGVVNAPDSAGFEAGNVAGTLEVAGAAVRAGGPRLVPVSSPSARGPQPSRHGAAKRPAGKIVAAGGPGWGQGRRPSIHRPRAPELFELFRTAKWGFVPLPGEGRASVIHVADLARLLFDLLPGGEDTTHMVFEPDDGRAGGWSQRELAQAIGQAVGRKRVWAPQLPKNVLLGAAALDGMLRRGKAKLTRDRVSYMTWPDWTCSPGKAPPPSRWTPRVDTREGLKATAAWYRKEGWL